MMHAMLFCLGCRGYTLFGVVIACNDVFLIKINKYSSLIWLSSSTIHQVTETHTLHVVSSYTLWLVPYTTGKP